MDAEYTAAMWSDAGVGVAARIIMKHFLDFSPNLRFLRHQSSSWLLTRAVFIAGTVEYMDRVRPLAVS
jgi:hypothetical protein